MADTKGVLSKADPHTRAKHQILQEYLKRWLPILARQSVRLGTQDNRLLYVDGFAGSGEYDRNVPGSPLIAVKEALEHSHKSPAVPIHIKFIEKDSTRVRHLRGLLDKSRAEIGRTDSVIVGQPEEGDCEQVLNVLMDEHDAQGKPLGPAFFFLDQYGYSSFSIDLIRRILSNKVCEVFSYLNWNLLHPFMTDKDKWAGITKAFGGEEWKTILGLSGQAKEQGFQEIYVRALKERGKAAYVLPFVMRNTSDQVIYWLFFSTNSVDGLEQMKRAMWKVDESGGFGFSDKHCNSMGSLLSIDDDWLADYLVTELDGREMTVGEVYRYVLTETPCYKMKGALRRLEVERDLVILQAPSDRRRGEFSDESMRIKFARRKKLTQLELL